MVKNYFKVAFRNLVRNKTYSVINILGLAVGIASCIVILLYVQYEFSFDRFNSNYRHIYRVCTDVDWFGKKMTTAMTPSNLGPALKENFPGVANYVRIDDQRAMTEIIKVNDESYSQRGFIFADPSFFSVFSFHLLRGNPSLVLSEPFSIVLTKTMSEQYFGRADPLGKTIEIVKSDGNTVTLTVTGVAADPPSNSTIQFQSIVSFNTLYSKEWDFQGIGSWYEMNFATYILLGRGHSAMNIESKLPAFLQRVIPDRETNGEFRTSLFLQPLQDIHLYSHFSFQDPSVGEVGRLYTFSAIALFLFLIACVNFMNLSTARYTKRAKEIGVRKAIGAGRMRLVAQFLAESILMSLAAVSIAVVLVELSLPFMKNVLGVHLRFYLISVAATPLVLLAIAVIAGLFAGAYPSLFLSSFRAASILKNTLRTSHSGSLIRKSLVVFQFSISIALIVATILALRQLGYIRNANLGFDKNDVVVIPVINKQAADRTSVYEAEVRRSPEVVAVSAASVYPGVLSETSVYRTTGADARNVWLNTIYADSSYLKTLGIQMKEGGMPALPPSPHDVVINKVAQKELGLKDAVGRELILGTSNGGEKLRIVGVIRDYNFQSLHNKIGPLLIRISPPSFGYILCRTSSRDFRTTLAFLKKEWAKINPDVPFDYSFLGEDINELYVSNMRFGSAIDIFSALAVVIACLGLFGLSTFSVEERTKEIGVRKVLGAPVTGIVGLLSKEFLGVVSLGNIIAWPVAYYFMQRWLQIFAYRTEMSIWIFLSAGLIALLVAVATVSVRAIRAATANPVESLRYE